MDVSPGKLFELFMEALFAYLIGKIIELVVVTLIPKIKDDLIFREVGYLIGNLKKKRDGIKQSIDRIQEKVDAAKRNGQDVYSHVTDTLTKARKMEAKIDGFLDGKTDLGCSSGWRLDLVSRYRLNKEAASMQKDLDTLKERSKSDIIAGPAKLEYIPFIDDFQAFTSRDTVLKDVMAALKDDCVNKVGICGLGGVGKTTIAEEIGNQLKIKGDFDEFVMVIVSQNVDLRQIQETLAGFLGLELRAETEDRRAAQLLEGWKLNDGKKKLVILDDLWSKFELKKIGISIAGDNKGCKVLLTSRNERVFQDMNVNYFSLGVLDEDEAFVGFSLLTWRDPPTWRLHVQPLEVSDLGSFNSRVH